MRITDLATDELFMFIDCVGADIITTPQEFLRSYGNLPISLDPKYPELVNIEVDGFVYWEL